MFLIDKVGSTANPECALAQKDSAMSTRDSKACITTESFPRSKVTNQSINNTFLLGI